MARPGPSTQKEHMTQPTTPKRSSCRAAMVDPGNHWRPITDKTPRGVKVWLIRKDAGSATIGTVGNHETFFTHWAPMPTFAKS